ncbi:DrmB family protein [Streptosporangium sp. NPDC087985]|uniref:DrmB family protein n=1 Tax=Streptosporangium sp. NPDC087985 TaxID=3366196 RepID=UPI0037FE691A
MGLRAGNSRKKKSPEREVKRTPLGAVRRSQLITTYGVGSLVAFEDQSFIVSGLDSWKVPDQPDLFEFRLEQWLGVNGFHLPPASDPPAGDGVRIRRFPDMYACPGCTHGPSPDKSKCGPCCEENIRPFRHFNSPRGKSECAACGGDLTPSRFVVACENGHLDDFPYWAWVHNRTASTEPSTSGGHQLSLRTTGRTASLSSIIISCTCGKPPVSMEGAFGRWAMKEIGVSCAGARPWLGRDAREQGCGLFPRALQRGSSAAWFPVVRSALSIPPFSQELHKQVRKHYEILRDESDETIMRLAGKTELKDRYDPADVVQAVRDYEAYAAGERPDPSTITGFEASDVLRVEEYRQLIRPSRTEDFESERPVPDPQAPVPPGIAETMLIKRLREVRVLQTFTRVEAPMEGDQKDRYADLSVGEVKWLPAVEVVGEGVFLHLDQDRLKAWESAEHPAEQAQRAQQIREHHDAVLERRAGNRLPIPKSKVTARFVLIHTLAHALINEWSLDAGYPASSLRERLYVSGDMAGILVYTATSDSAGSLGGLVGQGEPRYFKKTLESALERISWCSADPLCMEAEANGADSLNMAACHACMLIPETSCETNNSFLDRAMLIGTPDGRTKGFFRNER